MTADFIAWNSQSTQYEKAFATFLAHTDQKRKAHDYLRQVVSGLTRRRVLLDAGAGSGETTGRLAGHFERTIAVEPNPDLRKRLARRLPQAEIRAAEIMDVRPGSKADLVLCAHVLYYIPLDQWPAHLRQLASRKTSSGVCVIALQNPDSDCMRMLQHFGGPRFDPRSALDGRFARLVELATVPAHVRTPDLPAAVEIAAFMLGLAPLPAPPHRSQVEDYVPANFSVAGGYGFTCTQDFLHIG
ncbi:class I SAM-dependent methyltransferase [Streptomyces sp. NPDC048387]|uniref:class I SAM-dependent methyltransferase n=1 Tax=Streptomyces sp. NPDC048387 TaxID=3365542 RepID=UPI00371EC143